MAKVTLTVNGRTVSGECEDRTLLVHFIREKLGLTGTHVGCDTTQCGTCVVHMDGKSIKSCSILAVQASGSSITTIEGLSSVVTCIRCRQPSRSTTACNAASARPAW